MSVDGSLWYVKLADGDVERVTLDQLDEAFQSGRIDENSMVLAAGSERWLKLSELLGLADATPPPPPPSPMPQPVVQARLVPPHGFRPAPVVMRPLAVIHIAHQPIPMMAPPAGRPVMVGANSVRPVTFDLGNQFDVGDVTYPTPSRKRWVAGVLGTALVVGAAAFFVVTTRKSASASPDTTPAFAAGIAQPPPAPTTPPLPATPTPPSTFHSSLPGPSSVMDPTQRLTDAQKQKLLEVDKRGQQHPKSYGGGGGGGGGAATSSSRAKSTTFTTSGNKYDPLNSSL